MDESRGSVGAGKLRDPSAVPALIPLLEDRKKQVRKNAAWALGAIADEQAVAALTKILTDPDAEVQETARNALESIGNEKAKKNAGSPEQKAG